MPQRQRPSNHRDGRGASVVTGGSLSKGAPPPTRAYIRKWIHERAVARLRQVVWEGHGGRLLPETSASAPVRRFLAAVPRVLAAIKEIHTLAVTDGAEVLKARSAPPSPRELLLSKDANGLTPLHKAAGLGNVACVRVILARALDAVRSEDDEGKLPLHYAACAVGSSGPRDEAKELTYHLLVEAGSDEKHTDDRGKTASYYLQHPGEIDPSRLRMIPDAPRTAQSAEENRITDSAFWVAWRLIGPGASERRLRAGGGDAAAPASVEASAGKEEGEAAEGEEEEEPEPRARDAETSAQGAVAEAASAATSPVRSPPGRAASPPGRPSPPPSPSVPAAAASTSTASAPSTPSSPPSTGQGPKGPQTPLPQGSRDSHPETDELLVPAGGPGKPSGVKEEIVRQFSIDEERRPATGGVADGMATVSEGASEPTTARTSVVGDEEIRRAARDGDLGVLVNVVLSGEGSRLLGLTSPDPKAQNFLSSVPVHMEMIGSIHEAASRGSVREVQARLDRRKFAIAKEPSVGATPLHSAVLGAWLRSSQPSGAADVSEAMINYLGSRFPESLNQRDRFGRTPLHYACAISDEEKRLRLYHMLRQLGADPDIADNLGSTPAYYSSNPNAFPREDLLPYAQHLRGKGEDSAEARRLSSTPKELPGVVAESSSAAAADSAESSSTDTDDGSTKSNDLSQPMEMPALWTEEGQYLAKSLGEPLVKGLAEVSQKRPKDPVKFLAEYLQTLATTEESQRPAAPDDPRMTAPLPGRRSPPGGSAPLQVFNIREKRDDHGQTAVHRAAGRTGNRGALLQLIRDTGANVALRDDLYRTPRDVAANSGLQENVREIDAWIRALIRASPADEEAISSDMPDADIAMKMLRTLLLEGYDHIQDASSSAHADEAHSRAKKRNLLDADEESSYLPIITLLKTIPIFEERREWLHSAIRAGSLEHAQEILFADSESFDESSSLVDTPPPSPTPPNTPAGRDDGAQDRRAPRRRADWATADFSSSQGSSSLSPLVLGPATLAVAKNRRSRCSMHVAVLCQRLEIVAFIAQHFPETLHIGDNLERTPLHYAMGVESVDSLSKVLIQAGAKRVQKDLRGKQPSYYFINKSDIQRLQDEEIFRE